MFWLNRQLNRLRKESEPRPAYRAALWSELSSAHEAMYPTRSRPWIFQFATAGVCAFVVVMMTGTGVYAYDSPEVTPDHPLYQVRLGMEHVEGRFAQTPEAKEQFRKKLKRHRQMENDKIIKRFHAAARRQHQSLQKRY